MFVEFCIKWVIVVEERVFFDWMIFLEMEFCDVNELIGSVLMMGNNDDWFCEYDWLLLGGIWWIILFGVELELV